MKEQEQKLSASALREIVQPHWQLQSIKTARAASNLHNVRNPHLHWSS